MHLLVYFSSVHSLSHVWLFVTPWTAACQASLSITNSLSLLKLMSIELVTPSNNLILCLPFSSYLHSFPASGSFPMSQFFASASQNIGDFIYNIRPSNEYSGLISFGIYWFDLFEFQGTRESSTIPHFKSISSLAFSFLYSPTLTSIHDHWKNHSLD